MPVLKKIPFALIPVVFGLMLLEFVALGFYFVEYGSHYSYSLQQQKMARVSGTDTAQHHEDQAETKLSGLTYILHPYIGFSGRPHVFEGVNEFGFYGLSPFAKTSDNQLLVGVAGGSVAGQLLRDAYSSLKTELERVYPGKEVILTGMALGGMKQPQQLMALNYLLVLGVKFDVVINLDGYNEGVLPLKDNQPYGVAPMYPRSWNLYANKSLDIGRAEMIGRLAILRQEQTDLAVLGQKAVLRNSVFAGTLWQLLHQRKQNRIYRLEKTLAEYKVDDDLASQVFGPALDYGEGQQLEKFVIDIWEQSSRQILNLAYKNGFEYYHFLQPNQYVIGSKLLSSEEQKLLLPDKRKQTKLIRRMYKRLIRRGEVLVKRKQIPFYDLTRIYRTNNETLYNDRCCHLNKRGYQLMAKAIADVIQSSKR